MRKCLFILGLSSLIFSCSAQKNTSEKQTDRMPQAKNTSAPQSKPANTQFEKDSGVEFYKKNISDATKNDNTLSYGSLVSAKARGFNVVKTHFPSLAQNFRQRYLVLHYTALNTEKSITVLTERTVSAHYLVNDLDDKDIYQLVDENKRAYHAGVSMWRNDKNMNDNSIGIEIANMGYTVDSLGKRVFSPYNELQLKKVFALVKDIADRYQIPPANILGHSDVAPTRKQDPGPMFPWKKLYDEENVGMWYDEAVMKNIMLASVSTHATESLKPTFIFKVQTDLKNFGYDIVPSGSWNAENRKVVEAFQFHFRSENYDGVMDVVTYSILQALLQKYPSK